MEMEAEIDKERQRLLEKELRHTRAVLSMQEREKELQQRQRKMELEGAVAAGAKTEAFGAVHSGFLLPKPAAARDEMEPMLEALDLATDTLEGLSGTLREKCLQLAFAGVSAAAAEAAVTKTLQSLGPSSSEDEVPKTQSVTSLAPLRLQTPRHYGREVLFATPPRQASGGDAGVRVAEDSAAGSVEVEISQRVSPRKYEGGDLCSRAPRPDRRGELVMLREHFSQLMRLKQEGDTKAAKYKVRVKELGERGVVSPLDVLTSSLCKKKSHCKGNVRMRVFFSDRC